MKIKKGYVNIIALLALSLGAQNSYTASDGSWYSRLAPHALTGASWAALFAAQRALGSGTRLSPYTYFVPGLLGTALGTVARSEQGWGSALASSFAWQMPSFLAAFAFWKKEEAVIKASNLKKFGDLEQLVQVYKEGQWFLLQELDKLIVNPSYDPPGRVIKDIYYTLQDLHQKIIKLVYSVNIDQEFEKGRLDVSKERFDNLFLELPYIIYIRPAYEIYALIFARLIEDEHNVMDHIEKNMRYEGIKDTLKDELKHLVEKREQRIYGIISYLRSIGIELPFFADQTKAQFLNLLEAPHELLLKEIFALIRRKILQDQNPQENASHVKALLQKYGEQLPEFITSLINRSNIDFNNQYFLIKNLYALLQTNRSLLQQWQGQEIGSLLPPYDYIYAGVASHVIKPSIQQKLDSKSEKDRLYVTSKLQEFGDTISDILAKSSDLRQDVADAVERRMQDASQMISIIKKVIILLNQELEREELLQEMLKEVI